MLKKIVQRILRNFGKRLTNLNAPAKPYQYGVEFLKSFITPPTFIIDVGSADGTPDLTTVFGYDDYRYILVEANPQFYQALDSIQEQHPSVISERCFCGEESGEVTIPLPKDAYKTSRYMGVTDTSERTTVPMKTLDSITNKHGVVGPVLLKIDVEGAEMDVLRGATKTLELCDIVILESWIHVENKNNGRDFASVITFMKEHFFVVFDFFGGTNNKRGLLKHIDTVFVKETSPYRSIDL